MIKSLSNQFKMKITIFGTGYVGLVTGTCLAELGNEVLCIDNDKSKVNKLKKGIPTIYELGLKDLLQRNLKENRIKFSTNAKEGIDFGEIIFCAVGTPPDKDEKADLTFVKQITKLFGQHLTSYKVLVNKSTVPVGTAEICEKIVKEELKKRRKNIRFDIVSNPEFLREGTAIKDIFTPDRIIVGAKSKRATEIMKRLYAPIIRTGKPLIITDIKSAEIIKYAANAFLATKISFINEIANFCDMAGGDIQEIAKGIGFDNRIGPRFLHAGIGYGGSCLPKDVKALIKCGEEYGYDFKIIKAAESVNETQIDLIIQKLKNKIPNLNGKTIAIWGLSFKPKTDDIREAPALKIISKLLSEGAKIRAFDPIAMTNSKNIFPKIFYAKNSLDAAKGAHALILATEWDEFRSVDMEKIHKVMKKTFILDGRNIYDKKNHDL